MTGQRGQGGIHRRGWLHGRHHHPAAQPTGAADAAGPGPGPGDNDNNDHDDGGGDHARDASVESDPQTSLDQVLRRAAEARDAERDPDE